MAPSRRRCPADSRDTNRIAVPEITNHAPRELNIVLSCTGCTDAKIIDDLLPQLTELPDVSIRAIFDHGFRGQDLIKASSYCLTTPNVDKGSAFRDMADIEQEAADLCAWADLLVLAPIDANNLSKMLHGNTDNLLLEVLRSWNVSKKILMVPGMSALMWENPMTKKQLTKIRRKWNWVQVLQPILWSFEDNRKEVASWEGLQELRDAVRNQVDLMNIGHDMEVSPTRRGAYAGSSRRIGNTLPPELWAMILDRTGDWELAQALNIYTNLPPPTHWQQHTSPQGPRHYMETLELTILRGNLADVKHFIATHSVPRWLSPLCIKLIMRFAMIPLLSHLERQHKDLFWTTFGHAFIPDKASSVFGRMELLEFWRTSPSYLTKEYNMEALDGASRAGFVQVLEWWKNSGLPLKYTEAALEQASSQGHIEVLEWWKSLSTVVDDSTAELDAASIRLKPGKSICYATQNGHTEVVAWWMQSGIAFPHEDTVAKLASTHGHVDILQQWHDVKQEKIIFDNQVLVGATKNGHVDVLEWWRKSGLKVEYKTCDVEEALEDGHEGQKGEEVRRWWARNGLNLGVGTSEWMKTKSLNS